jgi:Uma2 family endonuclease
MPAATSITAEQFLALPDRYDQHGNRIKEELIEGEIVLMAPPSKRHDILKNRIARLLGRYGYDTNAQFDVLVATAFQASEQNVDIPDVSVVRKDRIAVEEAILSGAPEIAVEVISPSETAAHVKSKVDAYLLNGSESVWIVYPDQRSILVYSHVGIRELRGSDSVEEPLLPGFAISISSVFED